MRIRWGRYLILFLLAVVAGWSIAWFFNTHDRVEEQYRGGYSRAAMENPWLAAERFLQQSQVQVRAVGPQTVWDAWLQERLPPERVTLFGSGFLHILDGQRQAMMMAWLKAGGQMVVPASKLVGESGEEQQRLSGLLDDLGVYLERADETMHNANSDFVAVRFKSLDEPLDVVFNQRYTLAYGDDATPSIRVRDGERTVVLQFDIGAGRLTVVLDDRFVSNFRISDGDNALFLYHITDADQGREVWLVEDIRSLSLLAWLWQHGAWLWMLLLLLLVLWLWRAGHYLGPLRAPFSVVRRHLGEHLQASAHFLWRHGEPDALIGGTRGRILNAWMARYPQLVPLSTDARARWLAARSGLDQQRVLRALSDQPREGRQLVEVARTLQMLRAALPGFVDTGLHHGGAANGAAANDAVADNVIDNPRALSAKEQT